MGDPMLSLALLLALQARPASSSAKEAEIVRWIQGHSIETQEKVVAPAPAGDGVDAPFLKPVRAYAAKGKATEPKRGALTEKKAASPEGSFPLGKELPFPLRHEYVFGTGLIRPVERPSAKAAAAAPA